MNNNKKLKMKEVGNEYMEQYNDLLRYVFQVTDQELDSIDWEEKEIIRAKFPTFQRAEVIGWFDGDTLVSQVAVYPMKIRIFNAIVGNPPYQEVVDQKESTNGQKVSISIFQYFQTINEKIGKYTALIYPGSRWIHRSGKGLEKYTMGVYNAIRKIPNRGI